jgi:protoporphyrinogen oxidase
MAIIILGAGLTGLSAAYHLEQNQFFDFKIFEKETTPGGLCRSVEEQGFTFDYTGHLLHSSDPYFTQFLTDVVGLKNLATVKRRSFIYSHDTYTPFPFQVNLYGLPSDVIIECIEGFINRPQAKKDPRTFYDWALKKFGSGLTKYFFLPYQEKIFAYDIKKISASWTGRFVPDTSLEAILRGSLAAPQDQDIGYNSNFFYPKKGGINFWVDALAKKITTPIATNYTVEQVDLVNKIVTFTNGDFEQFDTLINTLPLDVFLKMLKEPSSSSLAPAHKKLLCNSVINFNLGINRPNLSDKHWIYLPEKQFIPYRLGFYHNFSTFMAPENCSSMYGEIAFLKNSQTSPGTLTREAILQMQKLLHFNDNEILVKKVMQISHAYVIFDFWREKNLPAIHTALASHNIHSIGRYGAWKYASMQESLLDGKEIAEELLRELNEGPVHSGTQPQPQVHL